MQGWPPNNSMEPPVRFAPEIFDRSRPPECLALARYLSWLAGRLTHRVLRKSRGR